MGPREQARQHEGGEADGTAEQPVIEARLRPTRPEALAKLALEGSVGELTRAPAQGRWCGRGCGRRRRKSRRRDRCHEFIGKTETAQATSPGELGAADEKQGRIERHSLQAQLTADPYPIWYAFFTM